MNGAHTTNEWKFKNADENMTKTNNEWYVASIINVLWEQCRKLETAKDHVRDTTRIQAIQ